MKKFLNIKSLKKNFLNKKINYQYLSTKINKNDNKTSFTYLKKKFSKPTPSFTTTFNKRFYTSSVNYVQGTLENFNEEVIKSDQPILLDFYASWCVPCSQLDTLLEKILPKQKIKFKWVKVDVDSEPELSEKFQIQSLPTMFGLVKGRAYLKVIGLQSEESLLQFFEETLKKSSQFENEENGQEKIEDEDSPKNLLKQASNMYAENRVNEAIDIFASIIRHGDSTSHDIANAYGGLILCKISDEKFQDAEEFYNILNEKYKTEVEEDGNLQITKIMFEIYQMFGYQIDPPEYLEKKLKMDAGDLEVKYKLAASLFLNSFEMEDKNRSIELLMEILKKDKNWGSGKAKKLLLKLFDMMGVHSDEVKQYRAKLSRILF